VRSSSSIIAQQLNRLPVIREGAGVKEVIFFIAGEILKIIVGEILLTGNYFVSMIFAGLRKENRERVT
jgi:hypothetical protein